MKNSARRGISSTVTIAVIVVLLILAASGWAVYFAAPTTATQVSTTTATQISTTTVTGGGAGSAQTVTTTVTTAGSSFLSVYGTPVTSNTTFTMGGTLVIPAIAASILYGKSSGIFSKYIPNAKIVGLQGAAQAQALVSGTVQMGFSDPNTFIPAAATGAPIQMVASIQLVPTVQSILVATNSKYVTAQDLEGGGIGILSTGSVSQFFTEYGLDQCCNFTANKNYTLTATGSTQASLAAVQTGSLQGTQLNLLAAYPYLVNGTFKSVYNFSFPYPSTTLWATTSFIQQHPDAVRAAIYAVIQAGLAFNENKTGALSVLETNFHYSLPEANFAENQLYFSPDGAISLSGTQFAVNLLYTYGGIKSNLSASNFISTQFVPILG